MARRIRLDHELVAQGFFATVDEAHRAVLAGLVVGPSHRYTSPGTQVTPGTHLRIKHMHAERGAFVSRGALKLQGALERFGLDVTGLNCLDVGCSTGGFTHCLLEHGAARICALDVGSAQFDWSLRNDPRVNLFERINICDITLDDLDAPVDLIVCDVSFTSVARLAAHMVALLSSGDSGILTLVKPQFELKRSEVEAGGVVTDIDAQLRAVDRVAASFEALGLTVCGLAPSVITGRKGNQEYFVSARRTVKSPSSSRDLLLSQLRAELSAGCDTL